MASGGSCATTVRTAPGWRAASASAFTAPPLLANTSTGPPQAAAITRLRSPAWTCGDGGVASVRTLRPVPRGS